MCVVVSIFVLALLFTLSLLLPILILVLAILSWLVFEPYLLHCLKMRLDWLQWICFIYYFFTSQWRKQANCIYVNRSRVFCLFPHFFCLHLHSLFLWPWPIMVLISFCVFRKVLLLFIIRICIIYGWLTFSSFTTPDTVSLLRISLTRTFSWLLRTFPFLGVRRCPFLRILDLCLYVFLLIGFFSWLDLQLSPFNTFVPCITASFYTSLVCYIFKHIVLVAFGIMSSMP